MIEYTTDIAGLSAGQLAQPFFEGWWFVPTPDTHLRMLQQSDVAIVALDTSPDAGAEPTVVGFVTGLTDGVLYATLTLLEVLPSYQGRGIGSELVQRFLQEVEPIYRVDLAADLELREFYSKHGFENQPGLFMKAEMAWQSGRDPSGGRARAIRIAPEAAARCPELAATDSSAK